MGIGIKLSSQNTECPASQRKFFQSAELLRALVPMLSDFDANICGQTRLLIVDCGVQPAVSVHVRELTDAIAGAFGCHTRRRQLQECRLNNPVEPTAMAAFLPHIQHMGTAFSIV